MSFWNKKSLNTDLQQKFVTNETAIELVGGGLNLIDCKSVWGQSLAHEKCSVLASVVNMKVQSIKNARFVAVDARGKEIVGNNRELERFLRPNPLQSAQDLFGAIEYYKNLHGKAYIIKNEVGSLFDLYVVPNHLVTEMTNGSESPFEAQAEVTYYNIKVGNTYRKYSKEEVFVISDSNSGKTSAFVGQSRLVPLMETINTFIASYEASTELMTNRGMLGVLSLYDDSMPSIAGNLLPQLKEDSERLQSTLSKFGLLRKQFKYAITNKKASFVHMSSTIKDLVLIEIENQCKKDISYNFGVPGILLDMTDSKYSNMIEAKVKLYSDEIIPEANTITDALNRIYQFKGIQVRAYFDHLECFQEAKRANAQGLANLVTALNNAVAGGLITKDQAILQLNDYLTI